MRIPRRLSEAVASGNWIPFVGAGVSKFVDPAKFPTWLECLNQLVEEAWKEGHLNASDANQLFNLIVMGKHPSVAEHIKRNVPTDFYYTFLTERFHAPTLNANEHPVYEKIFALRPYMIITTNYDRIIEDAFARIFRRSMRVLTFSEAGSILRVLTGLEQDQPFVLFKIHGDIRTPSNIIFTENDYRRLESESSDYKMICQTLFLTKVILFMGFSMTDREILGQVETLRHSFRYLGQPHYILMKEGSISDIERTRWREDYGLETILYSSGSPERSIEDYVDLLAQSSL